MSFRRSRLIFAAPFLAIVTTVCVCGHTAVAGPEPAGKATVQRVVGLFSVWREKQASPAVFKEVASVIDYEEMSERALGTHWNKMKPVERSEFVTTFQHLIEERYYKRWHKIFNRAEIAYKTVVPVGDDLYIKTVMTVGKKQDNIVWRLSNRSGKYKIISIAVNKKDLLDRLSARLGQRLKKDNLKGVLSWMRDEADQDDDDRNHSKGQTTSELQRGV